MGHCRRLSEDPGKALNVPETAVGTLKSSVNGSFVDSTRFPPVLANQAVVQTQDSGETDDTH